MRAVFLAVALLVLFSVGAEKSTRQRLKVKPVVESLRAQPVNADTILPDTTKVVVAGYDKPLMSRKESFFVTNGYDSAITLIVIEFNYADMSNRQLHTSTHKVNCYIPAGETRQIYVSSWDKQLSFYYYQSHKPRRQSTPYKVSCRLLGVVLSDEK